MVTDMNAESACARSAVHAAAASGQRAPQRRLQWRWVYALLPLLIGLLWAVRRQPLSRGGHLIMQCAIVLLVYGLLALWLQTNRAALGIPKPAAKPKIVYVAYTSGMTTLGDKPASAWKEVVPQQVHQDFSLSALPLRASISLQDRRN